jgi:hypothetical protein
MDKNTADQIKMELIDLIENGTSISSDSAQELLNMLEDTYSEADLSKDTTPMIGTNPFRKSAQHGSETSNSGGKDFNNSLNYRVQKFGEFEN